MQFKDLKVIPAIQKALAKENYEVPTPIQKEAIPIILSGRDLLGCAQTGTGKTAAFAIPTLQLLCEDKGKVGAERKIRSLIVTPTRELALQIYESFCTYGKYTDLRYCVIFGGVSQKPQEEVLKQGVDILIATPGRLNDLINQKRVDLKHIKIFILDEADRMLDMGFINDIKKILVKIPADKQTLLFSATMPPDIARLSDSLLRRPAKVEITPVSSTVDTIDQYLYYVDKINKKDLLLHILKDKSIVSALVFTRTKHGADRIVRQLAKEKVTAQAIHGDKSQGARQTALSNFKNKSLRILIATDIAARGIDIDELSHVINYDLPNVPETYVHRIGRTGRAGLGGVAISFCDFDEKEYLADIEGLIGKRLKEVKEHPYPLMNNFPAEKNTQPRKSSKKVAVERDDLTDKILERAMSATNSEFSKKRDSSPRKDASQKRDSSQPRNATKRTDLNNKQYGTHKNSTSQKASRPITTKQTDEPKKKKYRMTADGTLKEKRSYSPFGRKPRNK